MDLGHALEEQEYSKHKPHVLKKFIYMQDNDGRIHHAHKTKKFAQRLLKEYWPANGLSGIHDALPQSGSRYEKESRLVAGVI